MAREFLGLAPLTQPNLRAHIILLICFFSSRRRHTRLQGDWSSDVCSSDLVRVRHDDPLGRDRHCLDGHVLQIVVGAECEPSSCDEGDDKYRENAYAIHVVLFFYGASLRINAVARIVIGPPTVAPFATSRTTGCSMMNSNG